MTSCRPSCAFPVLLLVLLAAAPPVHAQIVETVGTRALGMGGAFVAVGNDSSATWWNPAALAAGPFLDVAIGRAASAVDGTLPAGRTGAWSFALATPPFGLSYYGLRITDIRPTAQDRANREDRHDGVTARSLSVSQFGATVLQTLITGVHVGSTVKYVRGTGRRSAIGGAEASLLDIPELLDVGNDLGGGDAEGTVDLDVGALAVLGAFRVGGVVRNVREPEFAEITLPRQVRIGAAFDAEAVGMPPFTLAVDVDVRRYDAGSGARRVIAVGGEHWLVQRRIAIRGGARFNTVGANDRVVTGGASVSPRAGMFVEAHAAYGGDTGDKGWGIAARVSF